MALLASSRRRRLGASKEATEQFIAFQLRQEWCALPIAAVEKVTVMGKVFGDPSGMGVGVTTYEDRELIVVDVGQRIFGDRDADGAHSAAQSAIASGTPRFLLVVRDGDRSVGLPVDSAPAVRRMPASAVAPLPEVYSGAGSLQCVSALAIRTEEESPYFVLDPQKLCNPQTLPTQATSLSQT